MEQYISENQFAPGSMLPKVQAAINFVKGKPGMNPQCGCSLTAERPGATDEPPYTQDCATKAARSPAWHAVEVYNG